MKIKVTNKELKEVCNYIFIVDAETRIDIFKRAYMCNMGIYGWNYDCWIVDIGYSTIAFLSGYRGFCGIRLPEKIYNDKRLKSLESLASKAFEWQKAQKH